MGWGGVIQRTIRGVGVGMDIFWNHTINLFSEFLLTQGICGHDNSIIKFQTKNRCTSGCRIPGNKTTKKSVL